MPAFVTSGSTPFALLRGRQKNLTYAFALSVNRCGNFGLRLEQATFVRRGFSPSASLCIAIGLRQGQAPALRRMVYRNGNLFVGNGLVPFRADMLRNGSNPSPTMDGLPELKFGCRERPCAVPCGHVVEGITLSA